MPKPPTVPMEERFWAKVAKGGPTDCWRWLGSKRPGGYGTFYFGPSHYEYAHRVSYRLAHGAIPDGLHLDHLCRHPWCVNPTHLDPVTATVNALRGQAPMVMVYKTNRCLRGHDLAVHEYLRGNGRRMCGACAHLRKVLLVAERSYARALRRGDMVTASVALDRVVATRALLGRPVEMAVTA